jgi:transaldolase
MDYLMNIKIFADGSNINEIFDLYENNKLVKGFTTNPSLMKKAGVTNYEKFIKDVTSKIKDLSISFEVFADDYHGMLYQAQKIASFGENIHVKIPIVNTAGEPTYDLIHKLNENNVKVNVTAVFTVEQLLLLKDHLPSAPNTTNIVSVFAGRIADTGRNPIDTIKVAKALLKNQCELLWASTREVYNIYEADCVGCDIITVTPNQIKKLSLQDKNLDEYSIETVKMFYNDAQSSGLQL